jgi:LacI family transcriptional regulator
LADLAGVSAGTVDRVIHHRGEVKTETRVRIEELIKKSGYTPNLIAKSLASRKTWRIAVVLPEGAGNNLYWDMPLAGIRKAAGEVHDFNITTDIYLFHLDRVESFSEQMVAALAAKPDGIVFTPVFRHESFGFAREIVAAGIPYVFLDSRIEDTHALTRFGQDTLKSGYLAARLMCFGIGPDSAILILNPARPDGIIHHLIRREKGFKSFIKGCNRNKSIRVLSVNADITRPDEPFRSLDDAFTGYPDIAGIFVTNSRASLVAEYLESRKRQDIILIGYDLTKPNIRFLKKGTIDFLLSQKPEDQGYQSIITLYRHLAHKYSPPKLQYSPIDIITKENIAFYR